MSTMRNNNQGTYTIRHDIINFSTAQSRFSFSKGRRFVALTPNTPTDFNESLPGTFGRRSPSFGVGERFQAPMTKSQSKLIAHFCPPKPIVCCPGFLPDRPDL